MNEMISLYDPMEHQLQLPRLKSKEEEERRGSALPIGWPGGSGGARVAVVGGRDILASALLRVFGNGPFGRLLSAALSRMTAGRLALLGVGGLSLVILGVMTLSLLTPEPREGGPGWFWSLPGDAAGSFLMNEGAGAQAVRPALRELMVSEAPRALEPAPEAASAGGQSAEPAPEPEAKDLPLPDLGAVLGGAGAGGKPKLAVAGFGSPTRSNGFGGGLRDALGSPRAAAAILTSASRPATSRGVKTKAMPFRAARAASLLRGSSRPGGDGAGSALGQLRFADGMSGAGRAAGTIDSARQFEASAFEPGTSGAGGGTGISAPGAESVAPIGGGAPDMTAPNPGLGRNVTPYQKKLDQAKKDQNKAMIMIMIGLALLAAGAALLLASMMLAALPDPTAATKKLAADLQKAGIALMAAGALLLVMGLMMAKKSKDKGKEIARRDGQQEQGRIVDECGNQATRPARCNPPAIEQPGNSVRSDAAAQGAVLQNGGPLAAGAAPVPAGGR